MGELDSKLAKLVRYAICGLAIIVATTGCSKQQMLEKASYPEDRALARAAIADLAKGNLGALEKRAPSEAHENVAAALPAMRSALPRSAKLQVTLIDAGFTKIMPTGGEPFRQAYLAFEITGGGQYALAQMNIRRDARSAQIIDFAVTRQPGSMAELTAFSFKSKGLTHYLIFLLALTAVGSTIAAIIKLWRSGGFRRRWLWTLGCLFGLTKLTFNWSTGQFFFVPLYVQLLSAGVVRPGVGPWFISLSIPVVALYVLFVRRGVETSTKDTGIEVAA